MTKRAILLIGIPLLIMAVGVAGWSVWNTPTLRTHLSLVRKYGLQAKVDIDVDTYHSAVEKSADDTYHCVRITVNDRRVHACVDDAGEVRYDNYATIPLIEEMIPESPYLLYLSYAPELIACAVADAPTTTDEFLRSAERALKEYPEPRDLFPWSGKPGIMIVLDDQIPEADYEAFAQACEKLPLTMVELYRTPADEWESFKSEVGGEDEVSRWLKNYLPYKSISQEFIGIFFGRGTYDELVASDEIPFTDQYAIVLTGPLKSTAQEDEAA